MKKIFYKVLYLCSKIGIFIFSNINIYKPKVNIDIMKKLDNYEFKNFYNENTFKDKAISKEDYDLSIIIPVYNAEKYIKKCLDSVVNQNTKYKYQIILINDGSTDNSHNILEEYRNKYNNIFIINEKNSGISVARNNGIRAASGKYIGLIDNDDWVTNDYVEKMLNRAYKKNADIVRCNHYNYSIDNDCIISKIYHENASIKKFGLEILDFKGYCWGGIIKKSLFNKIRFPEGYWYEDIMMRYTLMRICNGYEHVEDYLYYYALHKTNASKTLWKKTSLRTYEAYHILNYLTNFNLNNGIKMDYILYNQLLFELGPSMWFKVYKMNKKYLENMFLKFCELSNKYSIEKCEFWYTNKYISKAFKTKNYLLWYITSANWLIKVHIGYVK